MPINVKGVIFSFKKKKEIKANITGVIPIIKDALVPLVSTSPANCKRNVQGTVKKATAINFGRSFLSGHTNFLLIAKGINTIDEIINR
jgi:hypothetical protein